MKTFIQSSAGNLATTSLEASIAHDDSFSDRRTGSVNYEEVVGSQLDQVRKCEAWSGCKWNGAAALTAKYQSDYVQTEQAEAVKIGREYHPVTNPNPNLPCHDSIFVTGTLLSDTEKEAQRFRDA